ncbi:MAG: hypothetical protein QG608_3761 [Actinomycetota bacterium]|nr:hypothetical protein [Actinomycetota bacterium]
MTQDGAGVGTGRWSSGDRAAWYEARDAMMLLREVLVAAGVGRAFPYLRADLNAFGDGIVELGRTTPEAAARVADLLRLGLSVDSQTVDTRNETRG